jgi:hypothetical protein
MKKVKFIILLILITVSFIGCTGSNENASTENITNNKELTQKERLDDFEYMYTILKENYPYFEVNKRQSGIDWLSKKNEYISQIKVTTSDDSFINALESILSELNNGHTAMLPKSFYYYAKSVYETNPKGAEALLKQLNNPKALSRYSTMPDTASEFQLPSNNIIPDNVKTNILEKDKVAYLSVQMFNTFNIEGDMKEIKPFLQTIKDYKSLIIDIRGNGGGDSRYWSDNIVPMLINKPVENKQYIAYRGGSFVEGFIKCMNGVGYDSLYPISTMDEVKLKNLPTELKESFKYYSINIMNYQPKDSVGFNGKIYLLIDNRVFSSSDAFVTFAKSTGFATLVGEKTDGDGIGSDPAVCVLSNSGYVFRFTKEMGMTSDGTCNFEHKTEPDIKVTAKVGSNTSKDEAIQAVLKIVD